MDSKWARFFVVMVGNALFAVGVHFLTAADVISAFSEGYIRGIVAAVSVIWALKGLDLEAMSPGS